MTKEADLENLARLLMPYVYPKWPMRWGWTELPENCKEACREAARRVIEGLAPHD